MSVQGPIDNGGPSEKIDLAELFAAQVRACPGAIAIQTRDESISYVELHARANRLANVIRAAGVGVETPVGILMDQCVEHIVAQVSICKVGATCVPLDPGDPREHIAWMMQDAETSLVITNASSHDMVPDALRLCVDADAAKIVRGSSTCPLPGAGAQARTHILYAFDPTGQPQAIEVLARDLARLVLGSDDAPITASDVVAQLAGLGLTAKLREVWGPLLSGARIRL